MGNNDAGDIEDKGMSQTKHCLHALAHLAFTRDHVMVLLL